MNKKLNRKKNMCQCNRFWAILTIFLICFGDLYAKPRPFRALIGKVAYSAIPFLTISQFPVAALSESDLSTYSAAYRAIENIARVKFSLKYIEDDIEKSSDARQVVTSVRTLVQNYKLRDSLSTAVSVAPKIKIEDAKQHAQAAFEDLSSVYEYMSDDVDDFSGKKFPPRQLLSFAQQATTAADKELEYFFNDLPPELVGPIKSKVSEEFSQQ